MSRPADREKSFTLNLDRLLEAYPGAARALAKHGLLCQGCPIARFHTLRDAAALYGFDLAALVEEIESDNPHPMTS